MGLFNNYNKVGPGISKNAPKKSTPVFFFETLMRNFWKLMPVNFMYWLLSLLPFGFAAIGITNVTRNLSRDKHSFGLSDFFETIKKNIKQGITVGFLNFIITAVLLFDLYFFSVSSGYGAMLGLAFSAVLFLIFFSMKFYIWFIVITFNLSIKQIYKNSFRLVVANIKNNTFILLTLLLYWAISLVFYLFIPGYFGIAIVLTLLLFFYPTYRYLAIQLGVFSAIKTNMIDPYYEEHPDLDIDKRKMLGIYDDSDFEETFNDDIL